jgi:hypothetical protein
MSLKRPPLVVLLAVAAAIWLPLMHAFFAPSDTEREELSAKLAKRQATMLARSQGPKIEPEIEPEIKRLRETNPEWDFMRRTYGVLTLANRALATPTERERAEYLAAIDAVIGDTLAADARRGDAYFLLPYAKDRPFVDPAARSLFVDGEVVMMIAARELVEPRSDLRAEAETRAARVERAMRSSPSLSGESYPNECWTFCNTTALAALVMWDRTSLGDRAPEHDRLARDWVAHARAHLVEPHTGLLVSSYTRDGHALDGPEGSSLWMSAHNLLLVDEDFAHDQYDRARRELGATLLGFGWAREWPREVPEHPDVDSGPIVPILHASAGSSGLALLGASAFDDRAWLRTLLASLELVGFRDERTGAYRASNEVGDATVAYALSFGPLWRLVRSRG